MNFVHSITAILRKITVIKYHRNQDIITVIEPNECEGMC